MTHEVMARALLAALCSAQGIATLAIDLNRTHATNPLWLRHARFHLVWQAASYALLAAVEVVLVLAPGPLVEQRFDPAATLAGIPMLGCFAAFFFRKMYGGALFDPNGIHPVQITLAQRVISLDLNLAAEIGGALMLTAVVILFSH